MKQCPSSRPADWARPFRQPAAALHSLGHDVRLILPAYSDAVARISDLEPLGTLEVAEAPSCIRLLGGLLADSTVPVYLVEAPGLFDRPGNPYIDLDGRDWWDNPLRFAVFDRAVVEVALGHSALGWRPDVIHTNDWQTGLVSPLLADYAERPATLFTIHNMAYQGSFDRAIFDALGLPAHWWSVQGLEFYGKFSFLKGGIAKSDIVFTVSPTYARESSQPHLGYGLQGVLNYRADRLYGILNGIDYHLWDPANSPTIPQHFSAEEYHLKRRNKTRLQQAFGLEERADGTLVGHMAGWSSRRGST